MELLPTRQEFASLGQAARKAQRLWTLGALLPFATYVLPLVLWKRPLFPDLSPELDAVLFWGSAAWFIAVLMYFEKVVLKALGIVCQGCGHKFRAESFEITMASGRCGRCGRQALNEAS